MVVDDKWKLVIAVLQPQLVVKAGIEHKFSVFESFYNFTAYLPHHLCVDN